MHLSQQFLQDGVVLDCWVLERMHLLLKTYAEPVKNIREFEKTVLVRAIGERLRQLHTHDERQRTIEGHDNKAFAWMMREC